MAGASKRPSMVAYYNQRIEKAETALKKIEGEIALLSEQRDALVADIGLTKGNLEAWKQSHTKDAQEEADANA